MFSTNATYDFNLHKQLPMNLTKQPHSITISKPKETQGWTSTFSMLSFIFLLKYKICDWLLEVLQEGFMNKLCLYHYDYSIKKYKIETSVDIYRKIDTRERQLHNW